MVYTSFSTRPSSNLNVRPVSFSITIGAGVIIFGAGGSSGTTTEPFAAGFLAFGSGITSSGGFGSTKSGP
jgi:ABC-type taurine transport system ATPase subunit